MSGITFWLSAAGSFLSEKLVNGPLNFLVRRLYPLKKVEDRIKIDLIGTYPIDFNFGIDVPIITVHFRISNYSFIDIDLEKADVQLDVVQPLLKGQLNVSPTNSRIRCRSESNFDFSHLGLDPNQKDLIEKWVQGSLLRDLRIHIDAHFKSKMGGFSKRVDLQCYAPCEITKKNK